jgi:hypothetical protein
VPDVTPPKQFSPDRDPNRLQKIGSCAKIPLCHGRDLPGDLKTLPINFPFALEGGAMFTFDTTNRIDGKALNQIEPSTC